MYHKFLNDKSYFQFLCKTDQDLAKQTKELGCRFCHAAVHVSNYMRKPRGGDDLPEDLSLRLSFSCSRDGCRKRAMPPSIRFLGRFVYWSVHVILISAMLNFGPSSLAKISDKFGIDIKTIKRWRRWWQDFFPTTKFWKELKGKILESIVNFPLDLLMTFEKNSSRQDSITAFLQTIKELREFNK